MPVDPSFAITGPEWQIGSLEPAGAAGAPGSPEDGASFGGMLTDALSGLQQAQTEAAEGAQALATGGQAADPTSVVMAVERARLSMQLAAQIRTKSVEAIQDIFHTQI